MIITIEGKLGSGKTYWCVNYLAEKYYTWNNSINEYIPIYSDLRIITNIDELELPHVDLKSEVTDKGLAQVFNQDYVQGSGHCIYIIDEAQQMFDRKFAGKGVFTFFQMSRHYGVDILLITQDVDTLAKELRHLAEYTIKCQPRSRSASGLLRYSWESEGEQFKSQTLRFKKEVGKLYRSRNKEESMKMPITWRKYMFYAAGAIVVAVGVVYFLISSVWGNTSKNLLAGSESARAPASGRGSNNPSALMAQYKKDTEAQIARAQANPPGQKGASALADPADNSAAEMAKEKGLDKQKGSVANKDNEFSRKMLTEHEPLIPAKCYEERDGWRVCFEGEKPIGRYRVHNDFEERSKRSVSKVERDERFMTPETTVFYRGERMAPKLD